MTYYTNIVLNGFSINGQLRNAIFPPCSRKEGLNINVNYMHIID